MHHRSIAALAGALLALVAAPGHAERTAPPMTPRTLDTLHLPVAPADRESWEPRAAELRRRILFSAGLWPSPKKRSLRPMVTGRTDGPDYIIENVAIETLPGFWLCGTLYRPRVNHGRLPAIVNPHGHWTNGRLEMQADVPIAPPAPGPRGDGRANLVAIGVDLARQGFVVFAYDMVGYNDTTQANHQWAGDLPSWFDGVSLNGLQLWNSIRAVDYLVSRSDVDPARIGATGASGGGSQTFLLAAVDPRVSVSVPVNMVSAEMQGGCLCENGPGLRVGTDNVEIAALTAPRPQLLINCTGDWTHAVPTRELPALRAFYDLYGASAKLGCVQFNYGHNYNVESRAAMVAFFARWLQHGAAARPEAPFGADAAVMRVWSASRPRPAGALNAGQVAAQIRATGASLLRSVWPRDAATFSAFRAIAAPGLSVALDVEGWSGDRAHCLPSALLVLCDAAERPRAEALAEAARVAGLPAAVRDGAPTAMGADALWSGFHSCYNRTPIGDAVADSLAAIQALDGPVALVGLGEAGPTALFAAALSSQVCRVGADLIRREWSSADHLPARYAPALGRLGGVPTALALCGDADALVIGAGTGFPMVAARAAAVAGGGTLASVRAYDGAAVLAWLRRR